MREIGQEFAHYKIESLLGRGGMGEVYRAFDTKLHRRVALKLLLTSGTASPEAKSDAVARIIREARAAAAVEHPNKVSIFELGEVDGTPYLAMEYIAGSNLRAFVGDGAITWQRKLGWLVDIARALDAAHTAGLVHRDIKPENVMLREDGVIKVLDFGIARRSDAPPDASAPTAAPAIDTLTGKGVVLGTAAYMPPEQMHGEELDGRADQFSWGVMAFELFSGSHPWSTGMDGLALVGAMLTKPPRRLAGVPEPVSDAVARTLRAERDRRFANMSEIVSLLAPLVGHSGPIALVGSDLAALTSAAPSGDVDTAAWLESQKAKPSLVEAPTEAAPAAARTSKEVASSGPPNSAGVKRRRALRIAAVLAFVVALLSAGAVGLWRWRSPETTVAYCVSTVDTKTGPRCVGLVSEAAVKRRRYTLRLTSGPHGVDTVERLNSAGIVLDQGERPARTEVRRGSDGAVIEIVGRDRDGEEMRHEVWSEGGARVDYVEANGKTPRHLPETRVTAERREFDAHGFVRRELYFGLSGRPRASAEGVFGREREHSPAGFLLRETYLGWDGEPMANPRGVASVARTSDERAVELEVATFDLSGAPIAVDDVVVLRPEYTEDLDVVGVAFFDATGEKVSNLTYGTHAISWELDPTARTLRTTYLDEQGKPRQLKGDTYATNLALLDERGHQIEHTYLNALGNPVVEAETGGAIWRQVVDDRGRSVEWHILDPSKRPMACRWGYASRLDIRDATGRVAEQRHLDTEGNLTPWLDGPAISKITRDERGLPVGAAFFDSAARPAVGATGFASTRRTYDRARNLLEYAVFGLDGKPFWSREEFSAVRHRYDDNDDHVEEAIFDTSGAPAFSGDFAKKRMKHDERGLVIEESYFDANDNPVLTTRGFATVRYVRDRSGDLLEEAYFGRRGEPIAAADGYAKKKHSYDLRRRRLETALFDAGGVPVLGSEGWSVQRVTYDHRGLVVRESHLDVAGKAVVWKSGSASVVKKYDGRGNLVEVATLGATDAPIVTGEGHAQKKSTYDERDQLIEESLFGADGAAIVGQRGWSVRKLRYDELGNLVDESFFDAERKPIAAKEPAYARKRDKYDARRRLVETSYFDPTGAPAKGADGVETVRYVRDAYGNALETAYFDAANAPALSKDGKHLIRSKFDDAGRLIEQSFVDASGKPVVAKDGCAGLRTKRDERGYAVEETCVGEGGNSKVGSSGWASKRMLRDARGLVVDHATFAAEGTLLADAAGIARRKHSYDERGLLLETTFFGADDKPAADERGATALRYRYDEAGKQIEEIPVGGKQKP